MIDTETRDAVREACKGVLDRVDRREYLRRAKEGGTLDDQWRALGELGLLGLGVPEEHGGSGGGMTGSCAVMETLSEAGVPPLLYLLTSFARTAIVHHGTREQRKAWVAPTVTGEKKLCFAITEPDAGTNSFAMTTYAQRDGDRFVINGTKVFISGADQADAMLLVARTRKPSEVHDRRQGLSLLVVPIDTPGVELVKMDIDLHSPEHQFFVHFTNAEVPAANVIGEEGNALRALFDALNPERLLVSAWAVGMGEHVLRRGVDYARERAPFGAPIGSYQAIQHPLARAKAELEAARLMLYAACAEYDRGGDAGTWANMAKLLASEAAGRAMDAVIQTFGGSAFDRDIDVITFLPMVRLVRIAPLNNEMILNYLAERVLRLPKSY